MLCTDDSKDADAARQEAAAAFLMVAVHEQARAAKLFRLVDADEAVPVSFGRTWWGAELASWRRFRPVCANLNRSSAHSACVKAAVVSSKASNGKVFEMLVAPPNGFLRPKISAIFALFGKDVDQLMLL